MGFAEKRLLPKWWPCNLSPSRIEIWKEDGKWFAKLIYYYEYKGCKYCLRIPKLLLGNFHLTDIVEGQRMLNYLESYYYANVNHCMYDLCPDDHGSVFYLEGEQKPQRMTIEQIERELGYQIELVSEEKREDSYEDDECGCE